MDEWWMMFVQYLWYARIGMWKGGLVTRTARFKLPKRNIKREKKGHRRTQDVIHSR